MNKRSSLFLYLFALLVLPTAWLLASIEQPIAAMSPGSPKVQATTATPAVTNTVQSAAATIAAAAGTLVAIPTCEPMSTVQPSVGTVVPSGTVPASTPVCVPAATVQSASSTSTVGITATVTITVSTPATPEGAFTPSAGQPGTVDMSKIFPPGPGMDLLFNNCTSCHSFVCSIIGQRTAGAWQRVKTNHRARVTGMSNADYSTLFDYLAANFNDQKPVPELPPELEQLGCAAQ